MKKIMLFVAIFATIACYSQTPNVKPKPALTQGQWEELLDVSKAYIIAKLSNASDTSAKLSALISALPSIRGFSQSYLEDKMEEFYGSDWKNAGGPLHTACQIICGISYSVCEENSGTGAYPTTPCLNNYASCLRMCGLLPPGL
jgi:hypothetical protein